MANYIVHALLKKMGKEPEDLHFEESRHERAFGARLRMSSHDAHYGGNLVDGARMLALFGDVATELCILHDGDEGLFRAYDSVEFLAPVHAGDFIEAEGEITEVGRTSRKMRFEARRWSVRCPTCPRPPPRSSRRHR